MANIIESTTKGSLNTVPNVDSNISTFKFYKSPVFYSFTIYVISLIIYYLTSDPITIKEYIFGDTYMQESSIQVSKLFTYPYGLSSVPNIIKTLVSNPIILYLLLFSLLLFSNIVDINKEGYKPYFYSGMFNYIFIIILYLVHVFVINYIIKPKNMDFRPKPKDVSYASLYKTQWLVLLILSPIYMCVLLYSMRKLSK